MASSPHNSDYPAGPIPAQPALLALLLISFGLLALVYSLVLPLGEAADEAEHFALVRFIAEQGRPPLALAEKQAISAKGDASPLYHGLVALLTQHVDISALPELPDPRYRMERAIPYDRLPFKGLYHTEDEAWPFQGIVLAWHLARLVSIPLGMVTLAAIYLTARTLYPGRPYLALAAAGLAAFIPRFVINSAIVSDDNLVLPLLALAIYILVRIVQGAVRWQMFALLGGLMGLAAVAKYHSLLLLPETGLLLGVLAWQQRWGWRQWLRRWGLSLLVFSLVAGGWFGFLFIRFNQVAELGWIRGLLAPLGDPVLSQGLGRSTGAADLAYEPALGWLEWAGLLFKTFWFRLGRGHVITVPAVNWGLALVTLLAGLGLLRAGRQRFRPAAVLRSRQGLSLAFLGLHCLAYLSLVVARYTLLPTRETAQGRHLYPALTAISLFFVLGWSELLPALQGRLPRLALASDKTMVAGVGSLGLAFSLLALPLFIVPVYYPYLPIRHASLATAPLQHPLAASLAEGVELVGYNLPPTPPPAGAALPVTLYWRTGTPPQRDYLVKLCLQDPAGRPATCRLGHPADGRYPVRAWETGYLIRDEVNLPLPACLPPGDYGLSLAVQPLRPDRATATLDATVETGGELVLGRVKLAASSSDLAPSEGTRLWLAGPSSAGNTPELRQIRQAVTALTTLPPGSSPDQVPGLRFLPENQEPGEPAAWSPVEPPVIYPCPAGPVIAVSSFIVDPAVRPGVYTLAGAGQAGPPLRLAVATRPRNFAPPADIPTPLAATFGEQVKLLGYGLDLAPRRPGETVAIQVYWQALGQMNRRYVGSFHLLDGTMAMAGQIDRVLGEDYEYPNVLWAPGEIISQTYRLPIAHDTPPGLYAIEFGVYDYVAGTFEFLPLTAPGLAANNRRLYLGPIQVVDPAAVKAPAYPMQVELGDQFWFVGYDLGPERLAIEDTLHLALHWQARNRPGKDYTVFTQLIDPDGRVWGQQDNQPQAGRYPTTAWKAGETVVDRYELRLQAGAPPGQYRLLVGMYDLSTGQRLPALDKAGQPLPDNAIWLTTITVENQG